MITIWGRRNSINVQKAMWCVDECGVEVERIDAGREFGLNREDWYLAMEPNGRVPLLRDGDAIVWESHSIVRYLAAKYAAGSLWPEDAGIRARANLWMDWKLGTLHEPRTVLFWALVRTAESPYDDAAVEKAKQHTADLYAMLDAHLAANDYVAGAEFTMGDIPLGTAVHRWYAMDLERPELANLSRWYDQISARPAFQANVAVPLT